VQHQRGCLDGRDHAPDVDLPQDELDRLDHLVRLRPLRTLARRSPSGTILFLDEVHRFNRTQQDALLPHVEEGLLVLIGATTENPFFEVNSPLLSRSLLFRLESLAPAQVHAVVDRALADSDRGVAASGVQFEPEALDRIVDMAGGDARFALNAVEVCLSAATAVGAFCEPRIESAASEKPTNSDPESPRKIDAGLKL